MVSFRTTRRLVSRLTFRSKSLLHCSSSRNSLLEIRPPSGLHALPQCIGTAGRDPTQCDVALGDASLVVGLALGLGIGVGIGATAVGGRKAERKHLPMDRTCPKTVSIDKAEARWDAASVKQYVEQVTAGSVLPNLPGTGAMVETMAVTMVDMFRTQINAMNNPDGAVYLFGHPVEYSVSSQSIGLQHYGACMAESKLEIIVEALLEDDRVNNVGLPDFIERPFYIHMLRFLSSICYDVVLSSGGKIQNGHFRMHWSQHPFDKEEEQAIRSEITEALRHINFERLDVEAEAMSTGVGQAIVIKTGMIIGLVLFQMFFSNCQCEMLGCHIKIGLRTLKV